MISTRLLAAVAFLSALPAQAQSSDWSGFYGGIFAGAAIGSGSLATTVDPVENDYFLPTSIDSIKANSKVSPSANSGLGGFTLGINTAYGDLLGQPVVLGVEADAGALDLRAASRKTVTYPCCAPDAYRIVQSIHASGLYTLRARAGLADGDSLFYVTAGLAATTMNLRARLNDSFGADEDPPYGRASGLHAGWAAGLGYEWRLTELWSLKGEYLHADFGSVSVTAKERFTFIDTLGNQQSFIAKIHHSGGVTADALRIGVNYRL